MVLSRPPSPDLIQAVVRHGAGLLIVTRPQG
jgi:hypothetical protein